MSGMRAHGIGSGGADLVACSRTAFAAGMVAAGPWVQQKWTLGRSFGGLLPVPSGDGRGRYRGRGEGLGADGKLERRELGAGVARVC
jgi:hypothetical protein